LWRVLYAIMRPIGASLAAALPAHPRSCASLGLSGRTLEKHRSYGTGPKYRKVRGQVIYAWADLRIRKSTSDPGVGTVSPAKPMLTTECSRPHPPPRKRREPGSDDFSNGSGSDSAA
jgi:hypothetical protein